MTAHVIKHGDVIKHRDFVIKQTVAVIEHADRRVQDWSDGATDSMCG